VTDSNRRVREPRSQRADVPRDGQLGRVPRDPYEERGLRPKRVRPNTPTSKGPGQPPQGPARVSKPPTSSSSDSNKD
jgi:hypothetical protein